MLQNIKFGNTLIMFSVLATIAVGCKTPTVNNNTFKIIGNIKDLKTDSVFLWNSLTNKIISAPVKNGHFLFQGKVEYPELFQIIYNKEETAFTNFFLENATIVVNGSIKAIAKIEIKGSNSNIEYQAYRKQIKPLSEKANSIDKVLTDAQNQKNEELVNNLQLAYDSIWHQILEKVYEHVKANPKSVINPSILGSASLYAPDSILIDKIISTMDKNSLNNPSITGIKNMFADLRKTANGRMAPDFEMTGSDGKKVILSELRGKVVFVDFWASWCKPCIESFPEIKNLHNAIDSTKFEIIGFSIDKDKNAWEKVLNKYNLPWTQVVALNGPDSGPPKDYGILFIPTTYLIDKDGKIAGKNLNGQRLLNKIAQLIKSR